MTSPQPYKLMIKVLTKSMARFLKFIPMKSFVEQEKYETSFVLRNIGKTIFPKGKLRLRIVWPSQQTVRVGVPVRRLKRNESYETKKALTDVMCDGYALFYIDGYDVSPSEARALNIQQDKAQNVEFYSEEEAKRSINIENSFYSIKGKTWEELYEFWALIIATISLAIIALEKLASLMGWIA